MRFFAPQMLALLIFWAIVPFIVVFAMKISRKQIEKAFSQYMLEKLTVGLSKSKQKIKFILIWIATFFFILALARPQLGVHEEAMPSQGLDIVFLLDVSNSMLTEDIVPSRLKKAKHIIRNFVEKFSGDRVGIVAFAGSSYPAVPLTTDYEYIKQNLEVIDQSIIKNQGTDFKKALETGLSMLDRGGLNEISQENESGQGHSRVMIILSDGEDNEGEEQAVYPLLKKKGVTSYSIGIGSTKGGAIPFRDQNGQLQGYKKDRSNNMVLSKLETKVLEAAASQTGGKYYNASTNEGEVDEILSLVSGMDRVEGAGKRVMVYEEIFQIPLLVGVILFLISLFINPFKFKIKESVLGILAFILLIANAQASTYQEYKESSDGVKAYKEGDYSEAIRKFGNAQAENPDQLKHHMNLGDAFYKSESYEAAAREFLQVLNSKDGNEAAKGAYNLGRSFEGAKNLDAAMQAYQTGLDRLRSESKPDKEVEERIKRALEQVQQQKQKQKQEQQDKDKNKDQDENDQNKDQKEEDKKDQKEKKFKNPKPKFKAEKIEEEQAKKILKQLGEQEKKTQKKMMQNKNDKVKDEPIEKDW